MNPQVKTLVPAVLAYLGERTGSVSKTKLLKLLYLFDVEFYRAHRKLFTGFDWTFYHLGPWTSEIDEVLGGLIGEGIVSEVPFAAHDYEGVTLRAEQPSTLRDSLSEAADEFILIRLLNDWGPQPTGRLLDHVYFQTEPMQVGRRNERLDFSVITASQPERYKRSASNTSASALARKKREFQQKVAARNSSGSGPKIRITPPRYDEEFAEALDTLERLGSF